MGRISESDNNSFPSFRTRKPLRQQALMNITNSPTKNQTALTENIAFSRSRYYGRIQKTSGAFLLILVLLLLPCTDLNAQEKEGDGLTEPLQYNLEEGTVTREKISRVSKLHGKVVGGSRAHEAMGKIRLKLQENVTAISKIKNISDEGITTIKIVFKKFQNQYKSPISNFSYDSRSGGSYQPAFDKLTGNPFEVKINSGGEIKETNKLEGTLRKARQKVQKTRISGYVKNLLRKDHILSLIKPAWIPLPESPVKSGKGWNVKLKSAPFADFDRVNVTTRLTLKGTTTKNNKKIGRFNNRNSLEYTRKNVEFQKKNENEQKGNTFILSESGYPLRLSLAAEDDYKITSGDGGKGTYQFSLDVKRTVK